MAAKRSVLPFGMLIAAGVIASDTTVAAVTVSGVVPEIAPTVAVIVVDPGVTAVDRPLNPVALLTVATAGVDELHTAMVVTSCVD